MGSHLNVATPNIPTPVAESGQGNYGVMESGDTTAQYGTVGRHSLSLINASGDVRFCDLNADGPWGDCICRHNLQALDRMVLPNLCTESGLF